MSGQNLTPQPPSFLGKGKSEGDFTPLALPLYQ